MTRLPESISTNNEEKHERDAPEHRGRVQGWRPDDHISRGTTENVDDANEHGGDHGRRRRDRFPQR